MLEDGLLLLLSKACKIQLHYRIKILVLISVDLEGFISLFKFSKIHMGEIHISHDLKDSMKEISPYNAYE